MFAWLGSLPVKRKRLRRAVLNGDDPHWQHLAEQTPAEILLYGLSDHCHVRAANIRVTRDGVSYHLETPAGQLDLDLKMTGLFSVYNSLAALSVALMEGLALEQIKAVLEEIAGAGPV